MKKIVSLLIVCAVLCGTFVGCVQTPANEVNFTTWVDGSDPIAELKEYVKDFGLPSIDLFNDICMFKLKTSSKESIKNIYDVSEGLENRFKDSIKSAKFIRTIRSSSNTYKI